MTEETTMSGYLYETHLHTSQASACGRSLGRDYISRYIDMGYSGIIVTDHFFRGNCGIDRSLPWAERIHLFCQGYEDARTEGEKRNFPVFFGWEENYQGDEYLIYGLDEAWLIAHPEMEHWTRRQQYETVKTEGGCVVQAHPFRARSYLSDIHLSTVNVDAVEGVNAANDGAWNALAMVYGKRMNVPITAGSDNHYAPGMAPDNMAGVVLEQPLTCIRDYVDVILNHKPIGIQSAPQAAPALDLNRIDLPVFLLDAEDHPFQVDVRRFLTEGRY